MTPARFTLPKSVTRTATSPEAVPGFVVAVVVIVPSVPAFVSFAALVMPSLALSRT